MFWVHYSLVKPSCYIFRVITANFVGVRIFRIFTVFDITENEVTDVKRPENIIFLHFSLRRIVMGKDSYSGGQFKYCGHLLGKSCTLGFSPVLFLF